MWPLLFCSFLSLTVIIERWTFFSSLVKRDRTAFRKAVLDAIQTGRIKEAIVLCDKENSPLTRTVKAGLCRFGRNKEEISSAMHLAARSEIPVLERHLKTLSTIATITPIIGLAGTVAAACGNFYIIQARAMAMNPVTPGDIAGGLWQALLTTVVGLVLTVPSFVAYNYFTDLAEQYVLEMEQAAEDVLELMIWMPPEDELNGEIL